MVDTSRISCCFDEESEEMLADYREEGLGDSATAILDSIGNECIAGSTVLELGCGVGALTLEFVKRGAVSAAGFDLSPKMVQLGQALAKESGLSSSIHFEVGDGAVVSLPRSDIVVLDGVLCCYPDMAALVANSSSAASKYYALTIPDDGRLAAKLLRVVLPLQVVFMRRGFRFFIHPTSKIKRALEEKGFRLRSNSKIGWIWSVLLFDAKGSA